MGLYIQNNELEMLADFYRDPSYQKLAMFNSVMKTRGAKTNADSFNESRLYTDMLITLRSCEEAKQSAGEELAEEVIKIAETILDETLDIK